MNCESLSEGVSGMCCVPPTSPKGVSFPRGLFWSIKLGAPYTSNGYRLRIAMNNERCS